MVLFYTTKEQLRQNTYVQFITPLPVVKWVNRGLAATRRERKKCRREKWRREECRREKCRTVECCLQLAGRTVLMHLRFFDVALSVALARE
jgi:hypothetical protein